MRRLRHHKRYNQRQRRCGYRRSADRQLGIRVQTKLRWRCIQSQKPKQQPPVTNLTKNIATAVSKTYNNIKNSIIRQLRFGFKLSSTGSVCVNEPKFSSMSSGTISITPVSAVDGSNNTTYIYPGESFWMKDGMFSYTERSVIMKSPEDTAEKKRTGAVNIKVSPPTAKRG